MNGLFGPEELAFRDEVRAFLAAWSDLDAYLCHGPKWPRVAELFRALGARGWLALAWPEAHGGLGLPPSYEYLLWDEVAFARAARSPLATIVARTLLRAGAGCADLDREDEALPRARPAAAAARDRGRARERTGAGAGALMWGT